MSETTATDNFSAAGKTLDAMSALAHADAKTLRPAQTVDSMSKSLAEPEQKPPFGNEPEKKPQSPAPEEPGSDNGKKQAMPDKWAKERAETQALYEKVKDIQVCLVMQALGGVANQDRIKNKWKVLGVPNSGNYSIDEQQWYPFNGGRGGVGPVNLVKHVLNVQYHEAVRWIAEQFGESVDNDEIKAAAEGSVKKEKYFAKPIPIKDNIPFVKHYLRFKRALPEKLLDEMIKRGKIYADHKKNCVFFSKGIAEIRSSHDGDDAFKGLAEGSSRQYGFFVPAAADAPDKVIAVCESAIDSMSFRALNPNCSAISAAGANREFPRKVAEEAVANGAKVIAAFDADEAGDKASQALFNHFYVKLWLKFQLKSEKNIVLDEEKLFDLMESGVVDFDILSPEATGKNILFFNAQEPFADPAKPPVILLNIKENDLGIPKCIDFELKVSKQAMDYVIQKVGISRVRPTIGKDWNETLKTKRAELEVEAPAAPKNKP